MKRKGRSCSGTRIDGNPCGNLARRGMDTCGRCRGTQKRPNPSDAAADAAVDALNDSQPDSAPRTSSTVDRKNLGETSDLVRASINATRRSIGSVKAARTLNSGNVRLAATLEDVERDLIIADMSLEALYGHIRAFLAGDESDIDLEQTHRSMIVALGKMCERGSANAWQKTTEAVPDGGAQVETVAATIAKAQVSIQAAVAGLESALAVAATVPADSAAPPAKSVYQHAVAFWREGGITPDDYVAYIAYSAATFASGDRPTRDDGNYDSRWPSDPRLVSERHNLGEDDGNYDSRWPSDRTLRAQRAVRLMRASMRTCRSGSDRTLRAQRAVRLEILHEWRSCGGQIDDDEDAPDDRQCTAEDIAVWAEGETEMCPLGSQWEELARKAQERSAEFVQQQS